MINQPVILVVDDSPTVCKIVQLTLQREQMSVIVAKDGPSALAAVIDHRPDLILLDVVLPKMDGYSICQTIRKHPDYRETPIIMLTGKDGFIDRMRGRMAGSSEYLTKPFESQELIQTVKKYLKNVPVKLRPTPSEARSRRTF